MAISKTEFKNAFREVVSMEYEEIPADENSIDYCFSERFEKKMEKLIQSQKKAHWHYVNTAGKRVAVAALICLMLFTTACGIKPVREGMISFFTKVFDTFVQYFFEGDTSEVIVYEYQIKKLPEGFIQTGCFRTDLGITTVYENQEGSKIELDQSATQNIAVTFDAETSEYLNYNQGELQVDIYIGEGIKQAVWVKDTYMFVISVYGEIDIELMKEMILNVE